MACSPRVALVFPGQGAQFVGMGRIYMILLLRHALFSMPQTRCLDLNYPGYALRALKRSCA